MPTPTDTLDSIASWWIDVTCGCGRSSTFPVKMLIAAHGGGARPADIVARMKCSACKARPIQAVLMDDPQVGARGYVSNSQQERITIYPGEDGGG